MFLSVPLILLYCVCHPISLVETQSNLFVLHVCSLYMYELLYCNVCTLCTACMFIVHV